MFGIRTKLRNETRRRLREMLAETPLIYGGDGRPQSGPERVHVADGVALNDAVLNVNGGTITFEQYAFCGSGVSLLTGTHDPSLIGLARMLEVPRHGRDIVVETGAWLASNVTVLGPCRIGANAVVGAGSLVRRDVAPGEIVAGVPARHVGWVDGYEPSLSDGA